jgi:hypothetical protein
VGGVNSHRSLGLGFWLGKWGMEGGEGLTLPGFPYRDTCN